MSLPTLPTSEHDIVVPLPGQASIDSRLKHLRVPPHRRAQQKTPSGLVIDPVELLQCIGGSDATFSVQSTTTYSHPRQAVTVVSSSSANQEPLFSFPSSSEGEDHTSVSSHAQHPHEESTQESSRVVEHFEVDPHARSVLAFRRNSLRQFSSLVEESEDQETSSFPPPTGGPQTKFTTPLFVISDCIRKTYFPGQPQPQKQEEVKEETNNHVAMYEQISNPTLLRRIQSHPELSSLGEHFPKPIKVTTSGESHRSVSIFSSFAGELRSHVRATVRQNPADQSTVAIHDNKTLVQSEKQDRKVAQSSQTSPHASPQSSPGKMEVADIKMPDIPDGKPKEKKSVMKSLLKWGTESRVIVSDKETNMYSPGSF